MDDYPYIYNFNMIDHMFLPIYSKNKGTIHIDKTLYSETVIF